MIFFKTDDSGVVGFMHNSPDMLGKTEEELLKEGFLVESIPQPVQKEGMYPVIKYIDSEFQIEYRKISPPPLTTEQEIEQLKDELRLTKTAIDDLIMGGMM